MENKRLVVVSNRLPVAVHEGEDGKRLRPSSGGLVTALSPILERDGGLWIGWPGLGGQEEILPLTEAYNREHRYDVQPVPLTKDQVDKFYVGYSNQTIWPLFHDFLGVTEFNRDHWEAYDAVNEIYAEHVAQHIEPDDFIWVHDYQLMRVAYHLRKRGVTQPIAYFHHIPFPAPDLYHRNPWDRNIFEGLIAFDSLGFQTLRDRRNFVAVARDRLQGVRVTIHRRQTRIHHEKRVVRVGNFPISIDFDEFDTGARADSVQAEVQEIRDAYQVDHLILGLDRLDYTKGIPQRFLALERLFELHPEYIGKVSLVQVVVPSRTQVPTYAELKEHLDSLIGRINGRFGRHGYVPIHYYFKHLDRPQLLAMYRACEVALITPLRDGMNLVAKEFAAASVDQSGVIVLSEFTGSAVQLGKGALLVNPYNLDGTAEAVHQALQMPYPERRRRMRDLRAQVRTNDVHRWVDWFVGAISETPPVGPDEGEEMTDPLETGNKDNRGA